MRNVVTKRIAAAAGILAVGAAALFTGLAQAAVPGVLKSCSFDRYALQVRFPERGGWGFTQGVGLTGKEFCTDMKIAGTRNERMDVYTAGGRFLGSTIYNGARGGEIHATAGPGFWVA